MKKFALGCLIILAIAAAGFGAAIYWGYRAAKPMIQSAGEYVTRARELSALGDQVRNREPFAPPGDGLLTAGQVERFFAVQGSVQGRLGEQWNDLSKLAADLKKRLDAEPSGVSFTEFANLLSGVAGVYVDARRAQVSSLNTQKFSEDEYAWVRRQVYAAAGMQLTGTIDMAALEQALKEGANGHGVRVPDIPMPEVPKRNVELVRPHAQTLKELLPLAVLGL